MKITHTVLALIATGFLGATAFADNNWAPLALAVTQNGHGQQHFQYYQTLPQQGDTSVALYTNSGGGVMAPLGMYRPISDNGNTRFVIGTNQHGVANAAYIPVSSNFAPASQ